MSVGCREMSRKALWFECLDIFDLNIDTLVPKKYSEL